jgi:hypothetical protein
MNDFASVSPSRVAMNAAIPVSWFTLAFRECNHSATTADMGLHSDRAGFHHSAV